MTGELTIGGVEAEAARRRASRGVVSAVPFSSVVARLAEHATRSPDGVAVVTGDRPVSWQDLLTRVVRLRRELLAEGIGEGDVVAVLGRRDVRTIAVFLALESLGAVYLPLDPEWPAARTRAVLDRAAAALVVDFLDELPVTGYRDLRPDGSAPASAVPPRERAALVARRPHPGEVRYVIFTSGTTGTPKGAVVEQRGMLNHLHAKVLDLELSASDVVAFTAPLVFDISIWQMLVGVVTGATTVVFDEVRVSFPRRLLGALRQHRVTVVELVPTVVGWLTDEVRRSGGWDVLPALRWCVSTGEELHPSVAEGVLDLLPHVRLLNAYGPTECSDDVTHHEVGRSDLAASRLPVGAPVANTALYLLVAEDGGWRAAGPGEPGELFVGGTCVGRGYLADPGATASAFFADVLDPGSVTGLLYRTGDLAAFRDGVVHYLGRVDRQVKIAGVRMELDEIEAVLARHPALAHCAVTVRQDLDEPSLVAHYVTFAESPVRAADLEAFAGDLVPPAMVPRRWVRLAELPMTRNGKVDYRALARHEA